MNQSLASEDGQAAFINFTAPFDYSGHPTLTLPAGLNADRLPLSFQFIGRHLGEQELFRVGLAYEHATGTMPHPEI
jgi:amidase